MIVIVLCRTGQLNTPVVLFNAVLLVISATVAHVWIERPGIEMGNRVGVLLAAQIERMKRALAKFPPSQHASQSMGGRCFSKSLLSQPG